MSTLLARIFIYFLPILMLVSCSNKQMYESLQKRNEAQCYELPVAQQQECLQKARSVGYQDYQRELNKSEY